MFDADDNEWTKWCVKLIKIGLKSAKIVFKIAHMVLHTLPFKSLQNYCFIANSPVIVTVLHNKCLTSYPVQRNDNLDKI